MLYFQKLCVCMCVQNFILSHERVASENRKCENPLLLRQSTNLDNISGT